MKKILKITGIIFLVLIIALVSAPFLFKNTIKTKILEAVNESINADVAFDKVSLNLFSNFPNANISLENLKVINRAPFQGDTLVYANHLSLKVNLKDIVFKADNEPYKLLGFAIENALVNIHLNNEGKGNFDIAKPSDTPEQQSNNLALNVKEYSVENLRFGFRDDASKMNILLDSIFHSGKGDFANQQLDLTTTTKTKVSFLSDGTYFMKNIPVSLDAILGIDLDNQKYTFKDNKATINKLVLEFDGFLQLLENGQQYDLTFKTPTSSFENFLALIPEAYTKSISGVKTSGNFTVNGKINGKYTETTIPKLDIQMFSQNASFKYPDLPKTVRNINIDVKIGNDTEILDDTYVNINGLSFTIDEDSFSGKAKITNLIKNPNVVADVKGTINLENIKKAYPVKMDLDLKGILKANVSTQFDMASVEKERYENIRNSGEASLEKFVYSGAGFVQPFHIDKASLNFNTAKIQLTELVARTGKTDLNIKGGLDNFYGFMFRNEVLKGNFSLASNTIVVNDFMQTDETSSSTTTTEEKSSGKNTQPANTEAIKVPAFLDCSLDASAKTVVYDNLNLKNVSGKLIIKDEKLTLQNLKTDLFGGQIAVLGDVSTKDAKPTFNMKLDISKLNIVQTFSEIKMLEKIAPIAKVVQGLVNSDISVSGNLNPDMSPDLNSIKGALVASLQNAQVNEKGSPLISSLNSQFPKLNIAGMKLDDIKTNLSFDNGRVTLQPFNINIGKGASMKVGGSHGFDQTINYNLMLDVPPSMLGKDAEQLISKLSATEQQKLQNIPVAVSLTGDFAKPKVSADLKNVLTNLTQQIAQGQANKLIDKGVDKGMDALSKILGGGKTEATNNATQTQSDSTKTQQKDQVKKAVGNLLGGFLNRKKDTTSKK